MPTIADLCSTRHRLILPRRCPGSYPVALKPNGRGMEYGRVARRQRLAGELGRDLRGNPVARHRGGDSTELFAVAGPALVFPERGFPGVAVKVETRNVMTAYRPNFVCAGGRRNRVPPRVDLPAADAREDEFCTVGAGAVLAVGVLAVGVLVADAT